MLRSKWTWLTMFLTLAMAAAFLLQGVRNSDASSGDMSDPYLDPYALSLAHRHAGAGSETAAEKGVKMELEWLNAQPEANNQEAHLAISFTDDSGNPVEEYTITNEKLLHLIVVSDNLEQFQHLHPEYAGAGRFELKMKFPTGGGYKLYADFMPTGMNELTRVAEVQVNGNTPLLAALEPSEALSASVNGMRVTLEFAEALMPQMQTSMTYTFTDEKTGEPITDLELYLGAVGHVVAIDQSMEQFIHIHPLNWASSGPQAVFGVSFPKAGVYKMWGQFQRGGQTFLVPFVVSV